MTTEDKNVSYDDMMDNMQNYYSSKKSTSLSVEELLKPRYKVIADYPDSIHFIGQICSIANNPSEETIERWCAEKNRYPAIFKPLAWYEERDVSEMPEYVKIIYENGKEIIQPYSKQEFVNEAWAKENLIQYFPSTLEEYTNYINQQQCTHS